jgi:hypothetical protein
VFGSCLSQLTMGYPPPPGACYSASRQPDLPIDLQDHSKIKHNPNSISLSGAECGFMVCMKLRRSPRILIQKTDLRDFFRRTNPATRKSHPNCFAAYMRGAGEHQSKPSQPNYFCLGSLRRVSLNFSGYLPGRPAFGCVCWVVTA